VDQEELRQRLGAARVGRLATIGRDGRPRVQPVTFVFEGGALYWAVDQKPKRTQRLRRLADIAAHPAVELVVDEYDDDWTRLWWVRAAAEAEVVPGGEEAEWAIDRLAAKYPQHVATRPEGPVVRMRITRLSGWSALEP